MQYIEYTRVSTTQQGISGLGLEAQQEAVRKFANHKEGNIIASFTEVESGKKNNRKELSKAIELARQTGATLLIAKLDRLARNAAFVLTLRDSGVSFIACDMPEANTMTIGIMALMAEQERNFISERTKAALKAKKQRGEVWNTNNSFTNEQREKSIQTKKRNARMNKANLRALALVRVLRPQGMSFGAIAEELNNSGFVSARGGAYYASTVKNIWDRYVSEKK